MLSREDGSGRSSLSHRDKDVLILVCFDEALRKCFKLQYDLLSSRVQTSVRRSRRGNNFSSRCFMSGGVWRFTDVLLSVWINALIWSNTITLWIHQQVKHYMTTRFFFCGFLSVVWGPGDAGLVGGRLVEGRFRSFLRVRRHRLPLPQVEHGEWRTTSSCCQEQFERLLLMSWRRP